MTAHRDLDRELNAFLREGPEELPYESFDAVRDRTEQTRQRVVIGLWRTPTMNKFVIAGVGAVAVLVAVLLVGMRLFESAPPLVGAGPTASPSDDLDAYIGEYASDDGQILRIYPAGDAVCEDLDLSTVCWSLGPAAKPTDPGARGSATIEDGRLALLNTRCPYCMPEEVGATNFWELRDGGSILYGLGCEPEGVSCPDEGRSYERQV